MMRKTKFTIEQRLWAKVDKDSSPNGCWLFVGKLNDQGYGQISYQKELGKRSYKRAHRVAYEAMVGPIPEGLQLDHLCRVRNCVRPDHLEPVTSQVNMIRGMAPSCLAHRTKVCQRGHEFTPENTYVRKDSKRVMCRACCRIRSARRRQSHDESSAA